MKSQIASFIGSLGIGLCLPVVYANGAICHLNWILLGSGIGLLCFLLISFSMFRLSIAVSPKTFAAKQVFSLGYYVAPLLAYFLVLLMAKMVASH
jgi:hypothetical protein